MLQEVLYCRENWAVAEASGGTTRGVAMVAIRTRNRKSAWQIVLRMFVSPSALLTHGVPGGPVELLLDCERQIPEVTEKGDYLGKGPMASGAQSRYVP